jgi:hypothetical protein
LPIRTSFNGGNHISKEIIWSWSGKCGYRSHFLYLIKRPEIHFVYKTCTNGETVMNSHALKGHIRESSWQRTKRSKNNFRRVGIAAVVFASAVAVLGSGCARLPDRTNVAESLSTESGYPNVPIKRSIGRRSERMLPVKLANSSYLGRAQYICTPSGFGRTSGCFLRKS